MAGENFEKNSNLPRRQHMANASCPDLVFPLLWLCSDLDMLFFFKLESELQLFVFGSCCNWQPIVWSVCSIPQL